MSSSIRKRLLKIVTVPTLALSMFAAGCENGKQPASAADFSMSVREPATQPAPSQAQNITIDNFSFSPPALTVSAGTTVTWVNHDDVPHTVTADDKAFASKALDTDDRFSHLFTAPGTYSYFCMVHPHMTGQIIVK